MWDHTQGLPKFSLPSHLTVCYRSPFVIAPEKGAPMHKVQSEFKAASPMLHRRYDGKFYNSRTKARRRKATKPVFGYAKPHGQEA